MRTVCLLMLTAVCCVCVACDRPSAPEQSEGRRPRPLFGIYLLQDKSISAKTALEVGVGETPAAPPKPSEAPRPVRLEIELQPLLSIDDFVAYDWRNHSFKLSEQARKRMPKPGVFGIPFVVVAKGKPIYVGAFWTSASSASFPGPVIDVMLPVIDEQHETYRIDPAYPGTGVGEGPDPRGNPAIREAFEKAGKLLDTRSVQ